MSVPRRIYTPVFAVLASPIPHRSFSNENILIGRWLGLTATWLNRNLSMGIASNFMHSRPFITREEKVISRAGQPFTSRKFVKRGNNNRGNRLIRYCEIPGAAMCTFSHALSYVTFKVSLSRVIKLVSRQRSIRPPSLCYNFATRNEARAEIAGLYSLLRATEWHETGIIFPYAVARGFRASRYKRLTCSNVHDLLLHFPRGRKVPSRIAISYAFTPDSQLTKLPSRVVSRCASFSVSRSDMLSFPGENWRRRVGSVELEELRKGFQVIVLRSLR